ncbi:hypothetical protein AAY42_10905 [Flagellimonas eckloniae]|uniref:Uncharacterized protein n=1 Tax=Flagellimonas eckloniae TaxID=346185 RepID=A0A0N8WG27_9FLAO|nr:hypothetical protein AAY42_10905 [Allomuricauda eckloniae]
MNKSIPKFFVAVRGNKVVYFESNLSAFITGLREHINNLKSLSYYDKKFRKEKIIYHTDTFKHEWSLQRLI